jgi:hypothetical protein
MKTNKTLLTSPLPQKDIRGAVSLIYSRDRNFTQNSIATLMSETQQSLKNNQLASSPYGSMGVTRCYSNISTSSCKWSTQDVCWFSIWDDCNGNLLPYLESSFRIKAEQDVERAVSKALAVTQEQVKSILGDVTGISVAVAAWSLNKSQDRKLIVATAGPLRVLLWYGWGYFSSNWIRGQEGVFWDIDGKDSMLGKENVVSITLSEKCSHVIMGSKVV